MAMPKLERNMKINITKNGEELTQHATHEGAQQRHHAQVHATTDHVIRNIMRLHIRRHSKDQNGRKYLTKQGSKDWRSITPTAFMTRATPPLSANASLDLQVAKLNKKKFLEQLKVLQEKCEQQELQGRGI